MILTIFLPAEVQEAVLSEVPDHIPPGVVVDKMYKNLRSHTTAQHQMTEIACMLQFL